MPCTGSSSTWAPYSAGMCPRAGASAVDYGDGAVMELWPYRLPAGSARSQGLFVRFRNPEGKVYSYYTDRDTFARVTECLSPEHNPAWD